MTSNAALAMRSTNTETPYPDLAGSTLPFTGSAEFPPSFRSNREAPQGITSDANERQLDTSLGGPNLPPTLSLPLSVDVSRLAAPPVELLAEWNGCVTSIEPSGHSFSATLKGVVGEGVKGEEEDATIPVSDVSEWDRDLLRPGNFFRLCVTYEVHPNGQPRRSTHVVFRRLPAYRQHDLDKAAERGRDLARGLRVE